MLSRAVFANISPVPDNCTFQPAYKELGKERPWIECHVRIERKARESKTGKGNAIISNWVIEVVGSMMFVPTYEALDDETLSKALEKEFF